jgi:hypothetical protein
VRHVVHLSDLRLGPRGRRWLEREIP